MCVHGAPFPSGAKRFMPSCVAHTLPILRAIAIKVYTRTYISIPCTYKTYRTPNRNQSIDIAFVLASRLSCSSPTTILSITMFVRTPTMSSTCSGGTRHARRMYRNGKYVRHARRSVGRRVSFVPS